VAESTSSLEPLAVAEHADGALGIDLAALAGFVRATGPLAVVDFETTGLSDDPDSGILEFGAVLLDPDAATFVTAETLVRPVAGIPRAVQRLTGLADADVAEAPEIADVAKPIATALAGRTIIAHNADFERHFLLRFVAEEFAERHFLDTQDLLAIA
jgi:DNA polymerase III epsilon subunit-like protein